MINFINEHGLLIFLAVTAIIILGLSALIYVTLIFVTLVFREILSAKGILIDFVKWRTSRPIHSGEIPKVSREDLRSNLAKDKEAAND